MKIGIYLGTFDPIHKGHILVAERVQQELGLDKVLIIPCKIHSVKTPVTNPSLRYKMIRESIRENSKLEASKIAITKECEVTCSIDVVADVEAKYKREFGDGVELFYISGSDTLELDKLQQISEKANLVIVNRPGCRSYMSIVMPQLKERCRSKIYVVDQPIVPELSSPVISSTEVRAKIRKGNEEELQRYIPEAVLRVIQDYCLYEYNRFVPKEETRLIFVRHAQTIGNIQGLWDGVADREYSDLTPYGYIQARTVAQYLRGVDIDVILESPLKRTAIVAQKIKKAKEREKFEVVIDVDERLKEVDFGDWQGMTHAEVARQFPIDYLTWNNKPHTMVFQNGDKMKEYIRKIYSFLKDTIEKYSGKTVCIVSSGIPIKIALMFLESRPIYELFRYPWVENASVTTVKIDKDGHMAYEQKNYIGFMFGGMASYLTTVKIDERKKMLLKVLLEKFIREDSSKKEQFRNDPEFCSKMEYFINTNRYILEGLNKGIFSSEDISRMLHSVTSPKNDFGEGLTSLCRKALLQSLIENWLKKDRLIKGRLVPGSEEYLRLEYFIKINESLLGKIASGDVSCEDAAKVLRLKIDDIDRMPLLTGKLKEARRVFFGRDL